MANRASSYYPAGRTSSLTELIPNPQSLIPRQKVGFRWQREITSIGFGCTLALTLVVRKSRHRWPRKAGQFGVGNVARRPATLDRSKSSWQSSDW